MKLINIWGTVALAVCMGTGIAGAVTPRAACADLNNNGVCDAGDVSVDKQIANDGYFSTARSENGYKAPTDSKVGLVLSGKISGKGGVVYLVASGDIIVNDLVGSGADNSAVILVSTGGSIKVADNARIKTGLFLKLSAAEDVLLGNKVILNARNHEFGGQLYVYSSNGAIRVGEKSAISGDGYTSVVTNDDTGDDVTVGAGARIWSSKASVAITAGKSVSMRNAGVAGDSVVIGSHASEGARSQGGPGQTTVKNCMVEGEGGVRVFADGGEGSTVDVSGTDFKVPSPSDVTLEADIIVQ